MDIEVKDGKILTIDGTEGCHDSYEYTKSQSDKIRTRCRGFRKMILHHHKRSKPKQDNDHKCIQTMQDDEKQRNNQFFDTAMGPT